MSAYFVHSQGICETSNVGEGTTIWAFAHVLPGAVIGADVNICDGVFIENDVYVGDRVTVKSGVQLWDGVSLEDDVFVGPNVTFTNDKFPRSKQYPAAFERTIVERGASLGGGATILPGVRVGHGSLVGAGAVVTRDVPPFAVVVGNPGRIIGYTDASGRPMTRAAARLAPSGRTTARSSFVMPLKRATDMRGALVATEFLSDLPFVPQRFFAVFDVPSREVRGEHAHRSCEQFLVCLRGSVSVVVDDAVTREEILLDSPDLGVYLPALTWGVQYAYSADAVLGVFASLPYDESDYIRDYAEFQRLKRGTDTSTPLSAQLQINADR